MLMTILIFLFLFNTVHCTKLYSGQRIFNDYHMINFIDPAKHGFHIILDQNFVDIHLQPTKLPTVFASAIPLKRSDLNWKNGNSNQTLSKSKIIPINRVTKILYPENVGPEDGLLDGRTIKLLGLEEKNWYYVCVEFESNLNRHEMATGMNCQLRRTLDKFGNWIESMITDIELLEITQRSITVQFRVHITFPISLTVYLDQPDSNGISVPAQKFIIDTNRILTVQFGPMLDPDYSYGKLCILQEPLTPVDLYTAMGRAVRATIHNCYFGNLKTKPAIPEQLAYQEHYHMAEEAPRLRQTEKRKSGSDSVHFQWILHALVLGMVISLIKLHL